MTKKERKEKIVVSLAASLLTQDGVLKEVHPLSNPAALVRLANLVAEEVILQSDEEFGDEGT